MTKKLPSSREILIGAKAVIPTHRQWCKGMLIAGGGRRYCLIGACKLAQFGRICSDDSLKADIRNILMASIRKLFPDRIVLASYIPRYMLLPEFNDHARTTHADVIKVLDYAIKAVK